MYGALIIELAQVAEQEHMQEALMARARAQARRERRRQLGPGRIARAWTAFWAPRDRARPWCQAPSRPQRGGEARWNLVHVHVGPCSRGKQSALEVLPCSGVV